MLKEAGIRWEGYCIDLNQSQRKGTIQGSRPLFGTLRQSSVVGFRSFYFGKSKAAWIGSGQLQHGHGHARRDSRVGSCQKYFETTATQPPTTRHGAACKVRIAAAVLVVSASIDTTGLGRVEAFGAAACAPPFQSRQIQGCKGSRAQYCCEAFEGCQEVWAQRYGI